MVVFPRAKINLGLRITGKRDDGFHDIETLFFPLPLCDALEFVENEDQLHGDSLFITGIDPGGNTRDNLVMKAVKRLRQIHTFPFLKIHLHKAIPVGAGLGGGSSDAAFILRGINRIFDLSMDCETMRSLALELGSDCPFFIDARPAFATGRGEILVPLDKEILRNHYIVILNPGIHVSTKEAYQACKPSLPAESLHGIIRNTPPDKWRGRVTNDFEEYVFTKHPLAQKLKEELNNSGALFSLLSGSGSSVYGIFRTRRDIPSRLKKYLVWQGFVSA